MKKRPVIPYSVHHDHAHPRPWGWITVWGLASLVAIVRFHVWSVSATKGGLPIRLLPLWAEIVAGIVAATLIVGFAWLAVRVFRD